MRALKFVFFTLLSLFIGIYILIVAYVYFNQAEMVFNASKLSDDYKFSYKQKFEEINIPSFDGKKLNGLLFKANQSKGLVFYLHGNAGNLSTWGNMSEIYTSLGYDIFILDYRGFGKSDGIIENEKEVLKDVSIAYKKLSEKYNEQNIIITGYSIGTGPAAYLASIYNPRLLILQAPYYNFTELSSERVPFMPYFLKKFSFETNNFIKKAKAEVYIFHGNKDQVINYKNSVRLSELIKNKNNFFTLENQNHIGINENDDFKNQLKIILK
jgi:uncharacterized protein